MKIITWQRKPKRSFWFRIFGYGLNVINRKLYPAPFSVVFGHRKEIRLGRWAVHVLRRSQITGAAK
ncbi:MULTISPECIES: hypothetical protein [Pantoea]|uniref:Uncharacterized protein n=1 Tax=Pantoea brenneri TaxID=472694 RepID=A0A7Y6TSZ6_9GAMM|nr:MULTISPECIES: hypothetical protein [Pantoea]MBZ6396563.1 hypothetical protein [Pantoea sp.]MBZ6438362.1 hypothetical protein [Pantoea sp.]MDU7868874.1 hypothetical protein [Pantoea sp.]NUY42794.1 hypothetical protein [Pantoea brenneri]NUY50403.1 hypothetical protein [Pantoea brenneri]